MIAKDTPKGMTFEHDPVNAAEFLELLSERYRARGVVPMTQPLSGEELRTELGGLSLRMQVTLFSLLGQLEHKQGIEARVRALAAALDDKHHFRVLAKALRVDVLGERVP